MSDLLDDNALFEGETHPNQVRGARRLLSENKPKAIQQLTTLAHQGSVVSMLYLAQNFQEGPDHNPSQTEKWYRLAYDNHSLTAAYGLGTHHRLFGKLRDAEEMYRQGAINGHSRSMYWLGRLYESKPTVFGRKYDEIAQLFARASSLGHIAATNRLGHILARGRCGLRSVPRGFYLVLNSMVQGFRVAIKDPDDPRLG